MPFNASGVFSRLYNWVSDRDGGTKILAARVDAETDGIVEGLNQVVSGAQPFKGPVRASYGTAATPSHSFDGDTDTGMFRKAADTGALAAGGVEALEWTAAEMKAFGSVLFRRANILGTVSQSGGIPTGAIIERGSNANGTYVKLADGTMICDHEFTGLGPVSTASGSLFIGTETVWTLPATFTARPRVHFDVIGGSAGTWTAYGGTTATTTSGGGFYMARAGSSAATNFVVSATAIGRWY